MSGDTGAPWAVPYAVASDDPDGPAQIAALGSAVHSLLGLAYPCTTGTRPAHVAGQLIYETDTDTLRVSTGTAWRVVWRDTGAVSTGFVMQSGWSDGGCYYQSFGPLVYVHVQCNRTGSDLTFGANGGLSDTGVVQIPSAAVNTEWSFQAGSGGVNIGGTFGVAWRLQSSSGVLQITAGNPTVTISSGDIVSADFFTPHGSDA